MKRKKESIFARKKTYLATDNAGSAVEIKLTYRFFDPVPNVEIHGKVYELVPPFAWYEYTWMGIPILLIFVGGAIGGALGAAAGYISAGILRSKYTTVAKYALSGVVSAITILIVILAISSIPTAVNFVEIQRLKSAYEKYAELHGGAEETAHSNKRALLTNKAWMFVGSFDRDGTEVTDPSNPISGAKRYFRADGNFTQVFRDGSMLTGTWRFNQDSTALILSKDESEYLAKIIELTENTLKVESDGMIVVHLSE